jgi:hypothetical protein
MDYKKISRQLNGDGFWVVNKKIAKNFGIECAVLLADLISKEKYFEEKNMLTNDGYFFNTVENIYEDTSIQKKKQSKLFNILKQSKFIDISYRDIPKKRYFKINHMEIVEFLSK